MAEILCKNNKSFENFEVNENFLRLSSKFSEIKGEKNAEKAINYFISGLHVNDLCSKRLKVVDLTSDYINGCVDFGGAHRLVGICEALMEASISSIAEEIAMHASEKGGVRIVLIAGPSSSGKTTFCKKLSYAIQQQGLTPRYISLDDFYLDRHLCPLDEDGNYDFEHLRCLNLPHLQSCVSRLLAGEEVQLPRYDFPNGTNILDGGELMKLADHEILVMEGIHALNPELLSPETQAQPSPHRGGDAQRAERVCAFKIYISALMTERLPDGTYFPTTDNRLVRRMVRDSKYRGTSVQQTIARWPSVRRGEERWIVPFQKEADYNINSCFEYELCLLREHALPLLRQVTPSEPEYPEAQRLIALMEEYHEIPVDILPPYSLLREFLGGSRYEY